MGGRGAWAQRNKLGRGDAAKVLNTAGGGGSDLTDAQFVNAVGSADFPQIKSFSQKNIVDFNYKLDKTGKITIRDDNGRIFKGVYEGHGASRDTFGFKEGFVIKFDGLKRGGFRPGVQTENELKAYANINKALQRPAGKTPTGANKAAKSRVPDLIAGYTGKKITLPNGDVKTNVAVAIFTRAKGGHDTGYKYYSKRGRQIRKRVSQYISALGRRGVSTGDLSWGQGSNGNLRLHNIYFQKGTGKLKVVDLGL